MSRTLRANDADGACRAAGGVLAAMLLAGCSTPMQVFSSASVPAERITRLTWFMIILSVVVYAIVMAAMFVAVRRNRQRSATEVDLSKVAVRPIVIAGVVLPALVLTAVLGVAET